MAAFGNRNAVPCEHCEVQYLRTIIRGVDTEDMIWDAFVRAKQVKDAWPKQGKLSYESFAGYTALVAKGRVLYNDLKARFDQPTMLLQPILSIKPHYNYICC